MPLVWSEAFAIADDELELVWAPYVRRLGEALLDVRALAPGFRAGIRPVGPLDLLRRARDRRARAWLY
jgi:hypothetical protein